VPAKKLTEAESAWLDELEAVMKRCPSKRLQAYTTGDNNLTFYDKPTADAWEAKNPSEQLDAGALHERAGSRLRSIYGAFLIDSCAG
jgi:hypothetical protein